MSQNGQVTLTIDGQEVTVPAGINLIEAARHVQTEVPHYCYHPRLSVVGNCRICLVEVEGWPKLQIACNTLVQDGMVVNTKNDRVLTAREGVMEFLLINHPLDCTICDQAGECKLQDYAFHHGAGVSRFEEDKVHKPKNVSWGDRVVFDAERCIVCTRCIRFLDEVAETPEVSIDYRGDKVTLKVGGDGNLTSPYQMNIIDICPVGALTSRDFRFKSRLWFMKFTDTTCSSCARGCNVILGSRDDRVLRMIPRHNPHVNDHWMCDEGRLHYGFVNDESRLTAPRVSGRPAPYAVAAQKAAALLKGGGHTLLAVASPFMTNEELFALKQICDLLGVERRRFLLPMGEGDQLLVHPEKCPNSRGANLMGFSAWSVDDADGDAETLLYVEPREGIALPDAVLEKAKHKVVFSFRETAADVLFPLTSWIEKDGTVVSAGDRLQKWTRGLTFHSSLLTERAVLDLLRAQLGDDVPSGVTPAKVFDAMAAATPALSGVKWRNLGSQGLALAERREEATA